MLVQPSNKFRRPYGSSGNAGKIISEGIDGPVTPSPCYLSNRYTIQAVFVALRKPEQMVVAHMMYHCLGKTFYSSPPYMSTPSVLSFSRAQAESTSCCWRSSLAWALWSHLSAWPCASSHSASSVACRVTETPSTRTFALTSSLPSSSS